MFTDSHTHIYSEEYGSEQDEAVKRAVNAGVNKLFMPNIDRASVDPMLRLADSFPSNCFPMMGLHPTSVKENYKEDLQFVSNWLEKRPFYAIGEIGIDLYWDKTYIKEQTEAFEFQLRLAIDLDLPVVIHSREAFKEIFTVMDRINNGKLKGVFHSFSGNREEAQKALSYGFYLGINGIVSYKNSKLPEVLKDISPEKILLETDSPYLTPVPHRGKRNESAYLIHIAEKLSEIYGLSLEKIAEISTTNAMFLFKTN